MPLGLAIVSCWFVIWAYVYRGHHDVALVTCLLMTLGWGIETEVRKRSQRRRGDSDGNG